MNAIVERVLCCILFLLVVLGVIVMHISPDEEVDIIETQESTTCEEKETVIAPLPDYPLVESKESEIIGGYLNGGNGMPCEVNKVPEESEEETNEPETREEAKQETESTAPTSSPQGTTAPVVDRGCGGTDGNTVGEESSTSGETVEEQTETAEECGLVTESTEPVAESATETPTQEESTEAPAIPYYSVNGAVLDLDIQRYLYQRLAEKGIGWFMPYAIMIAYQESRFNPRAENANGQDKGLFQYRLKFYSGSDIFNPYEQIDIFTQQMANRANSGCSVNEMISRHMMSDYGTYNQTYVDQVLQHQVGLTLISN